MRLTEDRYSPDNWMHAVERMLWRRVLWGGVIVGLVYAVYRLKTVIVSLFVAAIIAYIMRPMAGWVARQRWFIRLHGGGGPRRAHLQRAAATFYVLLLLFVGGWYSARYMVNPFVQEVRNVTDNWDEYKARFTQYADSANAMYVARVKPEWRVEIEKQLKANSGNGDLKNRVTEWIGHFVARFGEMAHNIVEIVLLPVLAFYFALDSKKLKHEFVGTLPARYQRETLRMIREFNLIMYSFVVGQAILCALAGLVVGLGLWALGVKYPLTLGLMAGFTRAIPIVGPIIGGIPIIGLALLTKGPGVALGVLAFFTFLHFAESKFVMPLLIGDRLELHPVVIIVVLLIGQEFGGLLGMFFAAPVAALLRVIVRRYWLQCHLKRRLAPVHLHSIGSVPEAVD